MIKQIKLHNFRSYDDYTIDLSSGENLILIGENGKGKTTILESILFAFTNKQFKGNKINLLQKGKNEFYVELTFEFKGNKYIIKNGGEKQGKNKIKSYANLKIFDKDDKLINEINTLELVYKYMDENIIPSKIFTDLVIQNNITSLMNYSPSKRIELFDSLTIDNYKFKDKLDVIKEISRDYKIDEEEINQIEEENKSYEDLIENQYKVNIKNLYNEIDEYLKENNELKKEFMEYKEQLKSKKNELLYEKERIEKLEKKMETLNKVIVDIDKIKNIDELENKRKEIEKEIERSKKKIFDTNTLIKDSVINLIRYNLSAINFFNKKIESINNKIEETKNNKDKLIIEINSIKDTIENKRKKLNKFKEYISKKEMLINNMKKYQEKLEELESSLKIEKVNLKDIEKKLKDNIDYSDILEINIIDKNKFLQLEKCPICNKKITNDKCLNKILNNDILKLKEEQIEIKNKINKIENNINQYNLLKKNIKGEIEKLREEYNVSKNNKAEDNINKLEKEIEELTKQIDDEKEKLINGMNNIVNQLSIKLEKLNNKLYDIQDMNKEYSKRYNVDDYELSVNTISLTEINSNEDLKNIKIKKDEILELINEHEKKIITYETVINEYTSRLEEINNETKQLNKIKTKVNNFLEKTGLPNDSENINNYIEKLKNEISELRKMIDNINKELDDIKTNMFKLKNKSNILVEKVNTNEALIKSNKENIERYEKLIDNNKKKLEKINKNKKIYKILSTIEKILNKKNLPSLLREKIIELVNNKMRKLHQIFQFNFIPKLDKNISFEEWNELSGAQEITFSLSLLYSLKEILIPDFKLFIIDEPTNRMDAKRVLLLKEFLNNLTNTNNQIIVATHNNNISEVVNSKILDITIR